MSEMLFGRLLEQNIDNDDLQLN